MRKTSFLTVLLISTSCLAQSATWTNANLYERIRIAEQIGQKGAERFAKASGLTPLLESVNRTIPQGPDAVYMNQSGSIISIEAKGGKSALSTTYGSQQGTIQNVFSSAQKVIRSNITSKAEKDAAQRIVDAVKHGKTEVWVVRTKHAFGRPTQTILESSAVYAPSILPKVALLIGIGFEVKLRSDQALIIENQYEIGKITSQTRVIEHSKNIAGAIGGWSGAIAGSQILGYAGAEIGAFGGVFGITIGSAIGTISGGIVGYIGGEALATTITDKAINEIYSGYEHTKAAYQVVAEICDDAGDDIAYGVVVAGKWTSKKYEQTAKICNETGNDIAYGVVVTGKAFQRGCGYIYNAIPSIDW